MWQQQGQTFRPPSYNQTFLGGSTSAGGAQHPQGMDTLSNYILGQTVPQQPIGTGAAAIGASMTDAPSSLASGAAAAGAHGAGAHGAAGGGAWSSGLYGGGHKTPEEWWSILDAAADARGAQTWTDQYRDMLINTIIPAYEAQYGDWAIGNAFNVNPKKAIFAAQSAATGVPYYDRGDDPNAANIWGLPQFRPPGAAGTVDPNTWTGLMT